jgi:hypothetical protein
MSPGAASGHIAQAGYAYFLNGCDTGKRSFMRRSFAAGIGTGAPDIDQQALTGSWYRPKTDGQGVEVEVFPDLVAPGTGFLQGSWFTFDTAGGGADRDRWYTFSGNVRGGDSAAALTIYQNTGGNFATPPVTGAVAVGQATMSFTDCTDALLTYAFTDGSGRVGSVPLTRLTPDVSCGGAAASGDFGLSGNWYDKATSGQGIVVEVNPVAKAMFLAWYTYALNGQAQGAAGQRWYTGLASNYATGARAFAFALRETTGGIFNQSPPAPATAQVGTGTLTFTSCDAATLHFQFASGANAGQVGNIALARVGPAPASCVF